MSSGGGAGPLVPTFHGFVHNSMDGLVLFEACLSGKLHHVPRRPHDRERSALIKSGSIFIYEENASGIKRWTDGVAWSPSRILGNFLIYRELEKPFPPGEKKRAMKRKRTSLPGEPYPRPGSDERETHELPTPLTPPSPRHHPLAETKSDIPGTDQDKELERSLIGSLVDSYGFRPDGLVKKTMSISVNGISHHMVSYYKVDDVKNNILPRPLSDHRLSNISVRPELYLKQNFRAPVEETEQYAIDGHMHAHPQMMYAPMNTSPYGIRPGQYMGGPYGMYGMSTGASVYGGLTTTAWPQPSTGAGYSAHSNYGSHAYGSPYYKGGATESRPEAANAGTQSAGYANHYATSYQGMQRSASHGTPGPIHPTYATGAVQSSSSPYGATTSHAGPRHSYSGASGGSHSTPHASHAVHSPTTAGQSQHMYSSSASQPYAVRSPNQNYSMQGTTASTVAQSPHASLKSPMSATHTPTEPAGPLHPSGLHYRTAPSTYGVPTTPSSAHPSGGDLNGLGISANSAYGTHGSSHHGYGSYGHATSGFRSVGEVPAPHSAPQYAS